MVETAVIALLMFMTVANAWAIQYLARHYFSHRHGYQGFIYRKKK